MLLFISIYAIYSPPPSSFLYVALIINKLFLLYVIHKINA